MGIIVVLILAGAEHDEGAGFYRDDAVVLCKLLQLRVFGAGVEYDAAGAKGEELTCETIETISEDRRARGPGPRA